MSNSIQEAFDCIHADENMKQRTKAYLYKKEKPKRYIRLIPAMMLILICTFGYYLYFTPTVTISVDVNPSIELEINQFDRVIAVHGYNEDGIDLLDSLDLEHMSYQDAINKIINDENISNLLNDEEIMTFCIVSDENSQSTNIKNDIETMIQDHQNAYCYHAYHDDVKDAHEHKMSYGKYQAYLILKDLDPNYSIETVQNMTMKEIHHLIESLQNPVQEESTQQIDDDSCNESNEGSFHHSSHEHHHN